MFIVRSSHIHRAATSFCIKAKKIIAANIANNKKSFAGFTLLEILVALFIFSILSLVLASSLHSVITAQSATEKNAARLRELQMALLVISRDVEQVIDRPVKLASGRDEKAFVGTAQGFSFTHTGIANSTGSLKRSTLQRTRYTYHDNKLWRMVWPVLDQAPETLARSRELLTNLSQVQFQYLDKDKHFQPNWPLEGADPRLLPRAIKMTLVISGWGKMSQLYVLPIQN